MRALSIGLLACLVLCIGSAGPLWAQPNPILPDVDCNTIKANAQANVSDPQATTGTDNVGATGACAATVDLAGFGYDYKHVWIWVANNDTGGQDLYVCIELYGHPGDADGDGGYLSNDSPDCGAFTSGCGGDEVAGIVGPSEEIKFQIDPRCQDNPNTAGLEVSPLLGFTLTSDQVVITNNLMGAGPPVFSVIGGQGDVWQAAPLIESGASIFGTDTCAFPEDREGAVIFCIPDFDVFFEAQPAWTPFLFNWRVVGGHSADQLSEDTVVGRFLQDAGIQIQKNVTPSELCADGDVATFRLDVINTGAVPLFNVTVKDTLPAGLTYTPPANGFCELGAPVVVDIAEGQELTWNVNMIDFGDTLTCSFEATSDGCTGEVCNRATVTADVEHPCLPVATLFDSDEACVTCIDVCVLAESLADTVCVGEGGAVRVPLVNCATGNLDIRITCEGGANGEFNGSTTLRDVPPGEALATLTQYLCTEPGTTVVTCFIEAVPAGANSNDCAARDTTTFTIVCQEPQVSITKSADPEVSTTGGSRITIVVSNPGSTVLDPVIVRDYLDDGLAPATELNLQSDCGTALDFINQSNGRTCLFFTPFALNPGESCTLSFDVGCREFNVVLPDTAIVDAWCQGTDSSNEELAVSDTAMARITCEDLPGGEGCTPGYWKQPHHFWAWTSPYTPDTPFSDVFEDAFPGMTLLEVLSQGGGGLKALGRHTVAALLNSAAGGVAYDLSAAEVIDSFNAVYPGNRNEYNALKSVFEGFNEQNCPLGREPRDNGDPDPTQEKDDTRGGAFTSPTEAPADVFALQAYPNPVHLNRTTILVQVPRAKEGQPYDLRVYDVAGRLIRVLDQGAAVAGTRELAWDLRNQEGREVSSGIFFYRLRVGGEQITQRMIVLPH